MYNQVIIETHHDRIDLFQYTYQYKLSSICLVVADNIGEKMKRRELMMIVSLAAGLATTAMYTDTSAFAKGKQESSQRGGKDASERGGGKGNANRGGGPRGYERSGNPKAAGGPDNPGRGNPHTPY
jgi:hypothetical protein